MVSPDQAPDLYVSRPGGRNLAVDDRGDSTGVPILYCHGTPDSRLARHPDDSVARAAWVRLLAADRAGIGGSDPKSGRTPTDDADDLVAVLDRFDIAQASVLAWSTGSIFALALAGRHPDRVRRVVLAAPLVPADAYDDPGVLDGAPESRLLFADHLGTESPEVLGEELAPWLVPPVMDDATARAHLGEAVTAVAGVPGAADQLVAAVQASVAQGFAGIAADVAAQATPLGPLLDAIRAPVSIHVGTDDSVTPEPMARWLGRRLDANVTLHPGEGHGIALTRWSKLLADATIGGR